jgi:hypothetical protein
MHWPFDQAPNAACVTCRSVVEGAPILLVAHYESDHSWAFLDGQVFDEGAAMVVAMQTVLARHPALAEVADLPPGWTATRAAIGEPWMREMDPPLSHEV